jgi:hypothetical protein
VAIINLGIDLGSTGLRAAYSPPGEKARVIATTGAEWPWWLCEPGTDDSLPVSFASLKSKIGIATAVEAGGKRVAPADVLTQALDELRGRIAASTSATIGQIVISVPARFFSTQRAALLEAAAAAGLQDVSLITDSVAAVIGQTAGAGTGTFLVYGMGYDGFELGLVRAVHGRYRVLGYESAGAPGGKTFDTQVLRGWLTVLRQHGALPDEVRHGESGWLRLREIAEKVKEGLASGGPVLFPMFAQGPDGEQRLTVQFERPPFDRMVRSLAAGTIDQADALLTQAGLNRQAVETVLLSGGSTRMPQLRELIADLGGELVPTAHDHIARGAALHADQLGRRSWQAYEEPPAAMDTQRAEPVIHTSPLAATLLTAPGNAPDTESAATTTLDSARRLIKAGRVDEARGDLRRLIAEAQSLLDEIAAGTSTDKTDDESPGTPSASELLAVARARFDRGQSGEAIGLSHLAWRREPDRSDVFTAMLDLHCDAAMADPTAANFARDEAWLRCALQHDPSSSRIRGLLAERIYLHGKELHRKGLAEEARRALQHALAWDPEHNAAEDLLRQSRRRR